MCHWSFEECKVGRGIVRPVKFGVLLVLANWIELIADVSRVDD